MKGKIERKKKQLKREYPLYVLLWIVVVTCNEKRLLLLLLPSSQIKKNI